METLSVDPESQIQQSVVPSAMRRYISNTHGTTVSNGCPADFMNSAG